MGAPAGAPGFTLAAGAAAVVVAAAAVPVAAVVAAAAAAEQQDQNDNPPPVVTHTIVVAAHNRYLQGLFERRALMFHVIPGAEKCAGLKKSANFHKPLTNYGGVNRI